MNALFLHAASTGVAKAIESAAARLLWVPNVCLSLLPDLYCKHLGDIKLDAWRAHKDPFVLFHPGNENENWTRAPIATLQGASLHLQRGSNAECCRRTGFSRRASSAMITVWLSEGGCTTSF